MVDFVLWERRFGSPENHPVFLEDSKTASGKEIKHLRDVYWDD